MNCLVLTQKIADVVEQLARGISGSSSRTSCNVLHMPIRKSAKDSVRFDSSGNRTTTTLALGDATPEVIVRAENAIDAGGSRP